MQELLQGYDTAPRSLLWLIGPVAAILSLPSASGSLTIRSTLPVPPC